MKQLTELRLSHNQIEILSKDALVQNDNLRILDLCHNKINEWTGIESLGCLNLKQLHLKGNPICGRTFEETTVNEQEELTEEEKKIRKEGEGKFKQYNYRMKRLFPNLVIRDGKRLVNKQIHGFVKEEKKKRTKKPEGKKPKRVKRQEEEKEEEKEAEPEPQVQAEHIVVEQPEEKKLKKRVKRQEEEEEEKEPEPQVKDTQPETKVLKKKKKEKKQKKEKRSKEAGVVRQHKKATSRTFDVSQVIQESGIGLGGGSAWD